MSGHLAEGPNQPVESFDLIESPYRHATQRWAERTAGCSLCGSIGNIGYLPGFVGAKTELQVEPLGEIGKVDERVYTPEQMSINCRCLPVAAKSIRRIKRIDINNPLPNQAKAPEDDR